METTGWELFDTDPMTGTGGGIAGGWERGRVQFELSNHLGNVLVTISDARIPVLVPEGVELCDDPVHPACYRPIDYYLPQILTANDYYPFGMGMPGRKFAEGEYRYGFNGKEKDNDINSLTAYDYGFRIYNPAIGKFLSVDPLARSYPWNSSFAFAENDVMRNVDLDGLEKKHYLLVWDEPGNIATLQYSHDEDFYGPANESISNMTSSSNYARGDIQSYYKSPIVMNIKNPSVQYVVHGKVSVPQSSNGLFDNYATEATWTFSTAEKMFEAEKKKSEGTDRQNNKFYRSSHWWYATCDQSTEITKGQMLTYSLEVQFEKTVYSPNPYPRIYTNRITLKENWASTGGGSLGYTLNNGKINLTSRAVTNGTFDFVITQEGKLVIGSKHHTLSGGANTVQAAGTIKVYKGKVTEINNNSGHYKPNEKETSHFGDLLKQSGVDVSGATLNTLGTDGKKIKGIKL